MEDNGILFVDDDRDTLIFVERLFEMEGVKIHCAVSGEEALRKIEEGSFILVITDLNMPGLNGIELAEKVRQIAPQIALVMSTGDSSPEIVREAMKVGIEWVFAKPFKPEEMLAVVKRMVEKL